MKKLMMTISAVVLLIITAAAQDTTRQQSDQYRAEPLQQQQDTAAIDYYQNQQMGEDTTYQYREPEELEDVNLDSTFQELNEELEQDAPMSDEPPTQDEPTVEEPEAIKSGQNDMNRDENQRSRQASAEEIRVIEGKTGPNHAVVYEYQGELFYVDRETKEIVKVRRSELENSKHEVEIKEGLASGNSDRQRSQNRRSKGG